jgi:DNA-binding MarR family transcriptional regulator
MPQQHYSVASYVARRSIGYLCKRSHLLLVERIEPALASCDLTFTQYVVLIQLRDGGTLNASELGAMLCHDSGALTRVLDQLEARHLIQRERSRKDRRSVQLHLTEGGRRLIDAVLPGVVDRLNAALAGFSRADFTLLIRLLTKLVAQLEGSEAPAKSEQRPTGNPTPARVRKARELTEESA